MTFPHTALGKVVQHPPQSTEKFRTLTRKAPEEEKKSQRKAEKPELSFLIISFSDFHLFAIKIKLEPRMKHERVVT